MRSKFLCLSLLAGLTLAAAPARATAQRIVYPGFDSRDYDRREQARERAERARERAIEQSARTRERAIQRATERTAERAYEQRRVRNERGVAQSVARTNREIRNQLQRERRQFTRASAPRVYYRNW